MESARTGPSYSPDVLRYLARIYANSKRKYRFPGHTPEDVAEWQRRARPALRKLIGLDALEAELAQHRPIVELDEPARTGGYTRRKGRILSEPDVWVPFWLLSPNGTGPFPLAVTPHGHDKLGYDKYAGVPPDDAPLGRIEADDGDVAVQAVRRGFIAIAPATRGISTDGVPDIHRRHGDRDCHSQLMHCLLAGRTPMAERLWDVERLIDWALADLPVHDHNLLMLGNSGGGMITTYAAACDERIRIAIPSCSFSRYVKPSGQISHCSCNTIPGILRFGEFSDVAGLIAPRHLLIVNGRHDSLHDPADINQAVAGVRAVYEAAGAVDHFEHRYGEGGHRFFADFMWPFVERAMK